ncbi:MAG: ribonuclease HII [Anaerolineales bacterium]
MPRKKLDPSLIPPAPDLRFETQLWENGNRYIAGIDEAGRGALAGPVYAAAVILPPDSGYDRARSPLLRNTRLRNAGIPACEPTGKMPVLQYHAHPCFFRLEWSQRDDGALSTSTSTQLSASTSTQLSASLAGVRDSKEMTASQREEWAARIPDIALTVGVGSATPKEIDDYGILPATRLAIRRALLKLDPPPDHLLIDYLRLPRTPTPQTPLTKGDARSLSIAAASVLAKTARDAQMLELDATHPGYGFASHKGYGVPAHLTAIEKLGPSPVHRMSFTPLKPRLI